MNYTPLYTWIQSLYWATYCIMFNYAASFLQDKGFNNGRTGLVLGVCYGLSALFQPVFASFLEKRRWSPATGVKRIYFAILILAIVQLLPVSIPVMTVCFTLMLTMQNAMQSSVNALSRTFESAGSVNFSFARGMGSLVVAIVSFAVGRLLKTISSALLPVFYLATILALLYFLNRASKVRVENAESAAEHKQTGMFAVLKYPAFVLFMGGVFCLMMAHVFIDNFMLKIMQNLGGGNAQLGLAISLAAVTELPAMMLYKYLRKRFSCAALLGFAGVVWAIKHLIIIGAASPVMIYVSELMQFASFAFYVPAGVEFVSLSLPKDMFLSGQAFQGTAFSAGCFLATLIGGNLIDMIGMHATLVVYGIISVIGAAFFITAGIRIGKAKA